jgi:putative cell wall-binding protein
MEDYEVGQILFMTSEKSLNIIPIQVVEEVTKTTMEGKEKTYMVMFPDKKRTVFDIKKVTGKIFKNRNQLKTYMIQNATQAIEKMISDAEIIRDESFPNKALSAESVEEKLEINSGMQNNNEDDIIKVDLGNGVIGKVKKEEIDKVGKN